MKPRLDPRPTPPETPQYQVVDLEARVDDEQTARPYGAHHLHFPKYTRAYQLLHFSAQIRDYPRLVRDAILRGATVGLCWWHRAFDLETPIPALNADVDALAEYGEAIVGELQEQGYREADIETLYIAASEMLIPWQLDRLETLTGPEKDRAERAAEDDIDEQPDEEGTDDPFEPPGEIST
jgi:hypothetical protein